MNLRSRVYRVLEVAEADEGLSHWVDTALITLILANVAAVVLESVPELHTVHAPVFRAFETASLIVFSVEYLLRLWSCTTDPRWRHPLRGRLAFAARPMLVIDLLAILPGLLAFTGFDARFLRTLRLLRLLRMAKLARYSIALQTLQRVSRDKAPELLSTLFLMFLLLVMASSVMYFIEAPENDAFDSIPTAMWWGVATLTTVGYGDIYPVTALGRLVGAVIAVLGIAMFAIPAGILGAAFGEEMDRQRARRRHHAGE